MSTLKITRPGNHPGESKIRDYVFNDGVMIVPKAIGVKYAKILQRFHGCTVEEVGGSTESASAVNPGLTKDNTQGGSTLSSSESSSNEDDEDEDEDEDED